MKTKAAEFFANPMIDLRAELTAMRRRAIASGKEPDMLWRRLCSVIATSGSSVNADAFMQRYETELSFDLLPVTGAARVKAIVKVLAAAKVPRMRAKKALELSENYKLVSSLGGPVKATKAMLGLSGRKAKQAWVREFKGVGAKYSNDIWMSICDPDFIDAIALDTRVKNFAKALGFTVKPAAKLEAELLAFAKECGLSGWEFDRLIYNFGDLILKILKSRSAAIAA
jgi:hypothetical protein